MEKRLNIVRSVMADLGLEALVVTRIENILNLSGFSGRNAVAVITPVGMSLITDIRYREQAAK